MRVHRDAIAGLVLGLLWTLAVPLSGQAVLRGVVREDGNGRPLIGVQVVLEGTDLTTISSRTGSYEIKYPPSGSQIVLFRLVGFRPVRIRLDIRERVETLLDARLVAFAVQLDSIVVAGEMKQPRGMGGGWGSVSSSIPWSSAARKTGGSRTCSGDGAASWWPRTGI